MVEISKASLGSRFGRRCPACGHPLPEPIETHCPLCRLALGKSLPSGEDRTPYALAREQHQAGWQGMVEWVCFAGQSRLKHLALMKSSKASRRFAMINLLLLSIASGLFQVGRVGWRWVSQATDGSSSAAAGLSNPYWSRIASVPEAIRRGLPSEVSVELWWNPVQALVGGSLAVLSAFLISLLIIAGLTQGVLVLQRSASRSERRMTAAIHYGTSWAVCILLGSMFMLPLPLAYVAELQRWNWFPPAIVFKVLVVLWVAVGVGSWWFWLMRLGTIAPLRNRRSILMFLTLVAPLMGGVVATFWWFALPRLNTSVFDAMRIAG